MIRILGAALAVMALATTAHAATFSIADNDLKAVPADVAAAIGQDSGCTLIGKKSGFQQAGHDVWFVTSTCGGNDGQPVWLVSTHGKASVILDAGTFLSFETTGGSSNGMPDVTTYSVKPVSYYGVSWHFNGSMYREAGSKFVNFESAEACRANAEICKKYAPAN